MNLNPWTPLAPSQPTPNLAKYAVPAVTLLYLAGSLRQINILAKAFFQEINLYSIFYTLNGFELPDLLSYVTKFLPSILGYYTKIIVAPNFAVPCAQVCDPWAQLSSSAYHVGDNPNCLLYLPEDLSGRAQDLFATGENLMKSLTCDNLDLSLPSFNLKSLCNEVDLGHDIPTKKPKSIPQAAPALQEYAPKRAPWLLEGMVMMGLNSYFSQLSSVSSLWTPVQAAIPVLH
ncbi:hypothetical protein DSO57_1018511 [Entomophthora muscae]|uniref:Uncharacterized protein n=1 Tax=Entomophthora muscae TaxID=34485 RepID=A0ACC2SH20_9FUNG|nr:hypothetical protein DSO57_1018511 [Entomophthora muscae]